MEEAWSVNGGSQEYKVYLGLWTNWSRGSVLGQTLTVSRRDGDLLIAFTAFFVAFVGTRFWRALALGLHRSHSSNEMRTTIYHQRQIILRNNASPDSSLLQLLQLLWAWRRSVHLLPQVLPALSLTVFCVAAFTLASGFSSQISSSTGTEVLLDGTDCGILDPSKGKTIETIGDALTYDSQLGKHALNYVQECYSDFSGLRGCNKFVVERIPSFIDRSAPCPFEKKFCRSQTANIVLDTGYVDSHRHFGINAALMERILFRSVVHCSPIITEGFSKPYMDESGQNYTLYNYGPGWGLTDGNDSTIKVKDIQSQYRIAHGQAAPDTYVLKYV